MNRYEIAQNKPPKKEYLSSLKTFFKKPSIGGVGETGVQRSDSSQGGRRPGGRDSSRVDDTRGGGQDSSVNGIRGQSGMYGFSQGFTGPQGFTGVEGLTGVPDRDLYNVQSDQGTSQMLHFDPDNGRVGIGSPPPPTELDIIQGGWIQEEGEGLRIQGSGEGHLGPHLPTTGLNIQGSGEGFSHTGESIQTQVPVSQFFTLTGPNGFRIMIPVRNLNMDVKRDEMDYNRSFLTLRITSNQVYTLQRDIIAGEERLGLRNGQI